MDYGVVSTHSFPANVTDDRVSAFRIELGCATTEIFAFSLVIGPLRHAEAARLPWCEDRFYVQSVIESHRGYTSSPRETSRTQMPCVLNQL